MIFGQAAATRQDCQSRIRPAPVCRRAGNQFNPKPWDTPKEIEHPIASEHASEVASGIGVRIRHNGRKPAPLLSGRRHSMSRSARLNRRSCPDAGIGHAQTVVCLPKCQYCRVHRLDKRIESKANPESVGRICSLLAIGRGRVL